MLTLAERGRGLSKPGIAIWLFEISDFWRTPRATTRPKGQHLAFLPRNLPLWTISAIWPEGVPVGKMLDVHVLLAPGHFVPLAHSLLGFGAPSRAGLEHGLHIPLVGFHAGLAVGVDVHESAFNHGRQHQHLHEMSDGMVGQD